MKDSDLIYGLLRSFNKAEYSYSDIEYLTTPLRISETCLRNNLSRMTGKNVLKVRREGRTAYYAFTSQADSNGKNVAMAFRALDWSDWQGEWWGISLSVPDHSRKDRYRLIRKLTFYRFAALHPGFWIRPVHKSEEINKSLQEVMNSPWCKTLRFRFYLKSELEKIPLLWNVEGTQKRFRECVEYLKKCQEDYNLDDPQDALRGMMILGNIAVKQLVADPKLPDVFLPSDWAGGPLRKKFREWTRLTYASSEPYWSKIFDNDEQLTQPNPESYGTYCRLAP